jgi:hypothetical protein
MTFMLTNISLDTDCPIGQFKFKLNTCLKTLKHMQPWPTKSELRCAYYGRNKARIPLTSKNLPKVGRTD